MIDLVVNLLCAPRKSGSRLEWHFLDRNFFCRKGCSEMALKTGKPGSDWYFLGYHGTFHRKHLVSHASDH